MNDTEFREFCNTILSYISDEEKPDDIKDILETQLENESTITFNDGDVSNGVILPLTNSNGVVICRSGKAVLMQNIYPINTVVRTADDLYFTTALNRTGFDDAVKISYQNEN